METGELKQIKCGEYFCELCGDCMYCNGADGCWGDVDVEGNPGYHWYSTEEDNAG